jgi:deoxyribose-phosphate aldolase
MDVKGILSHVDHTLLKQTATWEDIKQIVDDGIKYETASVCIPPSYVGQAAEYAAGRV